MYSFTTMNANEENWDRIIIERMLSSIVPQKNINVYVDNPELKKLLETSQIFTFQNDCSEADFIFLPFKHKSKCDKPAIVFNFKEFRTTSNAIAVFFWQKGRPTIRFSSKRLNYFGLHVNGELVKFVSTRY